MFRNFLLLLLWCAQEGRRRPCWYQYWAGGLHSVVETTMNTVWSWSVIGLFYQCGIGCTVGFGAEVSVMWYGCLVWVVLCGAGTLLVSILGPAWRQSRTLGEVAQCIRWSSYYHLMIINLSYHYHPGDHHNIFLTSFGHCIGRVDSLRYLKRKEIILLSPFCKSVRPVRTPISHFPK